MQVRPLTDADKTWVQERTELLFSGTFLVSRDTVHDPTKLQEQHDPRFVQATQLPILVLQL